MGQQAASIDDILALTRSLTPAERLRLIERIAADLEADVLTAAGEGRSLRGLWSDLGPAPSDEALEEARREAWRSFPRDDRED